MKNRIVTMGVRIKVIQPQNRMHHRVESYDKTLTALFIQNPTSLPDLYSNITEIFFKSKNSSTFAAAKMATSLSLLEEWQSG